MTKCLRADWEVTILPGGPKWCELCLILYRTPFSTEIKVNKTDAVTVCLLRIFTVEQIILNPVTVAKHLVVLTVLEDSFVVSFVKTTAHRNQQLERALYSNSDLPLFQHSGPLSCPPTYYVKLRPLAGCIHKEGSNVCKV